MLKISIVMLVTAVFAGLLIYDPNELSPNSAALPINAPPRLANGVPARAQADAVAAAEASPKVRPEDIEEIVLKVLANRVVPQERDSSGAAGALPDKSVAADTHWPLPASSGSRRRLVPLSPQTEQPRLTADAGLQKPEVDTSARVPPSPILQAQICKRDEEKLTRLRASPARDEVIRFEHELGCERLRPQVVRLRESLGAN